MIPTEIMRVIEKGGDLWDVVPVVVGGIIGALAGGVPALLLAKRASEENEAREKSSRNNEELAKAFRLFATYSSIMHSFFSTRIKIDEMLLNPVTPGDKVPFQRRIKGLVGFAGE